MVGVAAGVAVECITTAGRIVLVVVGVIEKCAQLIEDDKTPPSAFFRSFWSAQWPIRAVFLPKRTIWDIQHPSLQPEGRRQYSLTHDWIGGTGASFVMYVSVSMMP